MLCYSENEVFTGAPLPYHLVNANKSFLFHYANQLYLEFIEANGDFAERKQAAKELVICRRKMDRMEKHGNFSLEDVLPEMQKLNRQWQK